MYCSEAVIRGTVFAKQGEMGGWKIGTKYDEAGAFVYQYLEAQGTELQSTGHIKLGQSLQITPGGLYLTDSYSQLHLPSASRLLIGT